MFNQNKEKQVKHEAAEQRKTGLYCVNTLLIITIQIWNFLIKTTRLLNVATHSVSTFGTFDIYQTRQSKFSTIYNGYLNTLFRRSGVFNAIAFLKNCLSPLYFPLSRQHHI